MNSMGRPRALADPLKRREVCSLIGVGAGYDGAARHVGCSVATIRREADRDPAFAQQLASAETAAGFAPLRALRVAANNNWRAAAWLLERTFPERFARRNPESLSPSEVRTLLDEVANIMADECTDDTQLKRMCERLDELQKARFGEYRSALQGDPEPKSAMDRYYDQIERDIEAVTGQSAAECGTNWKASIKWFEAKDRREAEEAARKNNCERDGSG